MFPEKDNILFKLSKSKFRSSFHLNNKMREYVLSNGIDKVRSHAYDFVNKRLKVKPLNDGKQTPMKQVHPVFIAQHACAVCCRSCINKWYHFDTNKELSEEEINYLVDIIILWIKKEVGII